MYFKHCQFGRILASLVVAWAVVGCSAPKRASDQDMHSMGGQSSGSTIAAGQMGHMDMDAMCDTHRKMQTASPEQRQAMMDQQMKGMSPEMRLRHMEMMQQHCK